MEKQPAQNGIKRNGFDCEWHKTQTENQFGRMTDSFNHSPFSPPMVARARAVNPSAREVSGRKCDKSLSC